MKTSPPLRRAFSMRNPEGLATPDLSHRYETAGPTPDTVRFFYCLQDAQNYLKRVLEGYRPGCFAKIENEETHEYYIVEREANGTFYCETYAENSERWRIRDHEALLRALEMCEDGPKKLPNVNWREEGF